jgi:hypothetical protein
MVSKETALYACHIMWQWQLAKDDGPRTSNQPLAAKYLAMITTAQHACTVRAHRHQPASFAAFTRLD